MEPRKPQSVEYPAADVAELLQQLMGDTGDVLESMGGFKIKVHHLRAFPWGEVFKALVYRDFRVYVTRKKADLIIEASP